MTYQELRQKLAETRKALTESLREEFAKGAKELFEKFPNMQSFSWTQYTPYFCDGDVCTFGVNREEPDINGLNGYEDIHEAYPATGYREAIPASNADLLGPQEGVVEFLRAFEDEDMLAVFGDHAQVTVSRDGTAKVEEHEHD